jgi:spore coat protein U-like protein
MKTLLLRLLAVSAMLLASAQAHAVISCSVSSSGFNTAYDPTLATVPPIQTSFTVNCTRALSDSASALSYTVAADNGINSKGINNQAAYAGNLLRYDVYMDAACGTQWKGNRSFSGSIGFGSSTTASVTTTYWGCLVAGQTTLPAGTYSDIVTMTLTYGANPQSTAMATFPVNVGTPSQCAINTGPGVLAFGTYVAYQPAALPATASFTVTCTNYLTYTLYLDSPAGTIAGLAYTLGFSVPSPQTGSGAQQTIAVTGTMAAGQSGVCATATCSGTNTHSVWLSY